MARIASRQIAGYYPVPETLLPSIASTVQIEQPPYFRNLGKEVPGLTVFDPCAGEGRALDLLARSWKAEFTIGCELEEGRAAHLKQRVAHAISGDAFQLVWTNSDGAHLLWLNPPYDHDPDFRRLEHRFLKRFTDALWPGKGLLLFLVPGTALGASAKHLATHFVDHRCWRLPDEHYRAFGQVLLVARRASTPCHDDVAERRILGWAREPGALAALPQRCPDPVILRRETPRYQCPFNPSKSRLEVDKLALHLRSWNPIPDACQHDLGQLLNPKFLTAAPPRAAHVALALTAGVFNGQELQPDDPTRHPALLASGRFSTELRTVGATHNDKGKVTGHHKVERPKLQLTVLDLATHRFHRLQAGAEPVGGDDPADWTVADLMANYRGSLMAQLEGAFPVLHDPREADQKVELPDLPRSPYPYQADAITSALKLLAVGDEHPKIQAEMGTGKTTMALVLAASLFPQNRVRTAAQLEDQGFPSANLPELRRVLVLCPPHLLASWEDEIVATLGDDVPVHLLKRCGDVDRAAADPGPSIALLSREKAKLGHRWRGVTGGRCPNCSANLPKDTDPKKLARSRSRCRSETYEPQDPLARFTRDLAVALLPYRRTALLLKTAGRGAARLALRREAPRSLGRHGIRVLYDLTRRNLDALGPHLGCALDLFAATARQLGRQAEAVTFLRALHAELGARSEAALAPARQAIVRQGRLLQRPDSTGEPILDVAKRVFGTCHKASAWERRTCGEPLFQADRNGPRTYPLASYIARRHRHAFQLLVIDEAHEYNHSKSAQSQAAQRLAALPEIRVLALTGSLMNGYASSLFQLYWMTSSRFRETYGRDDLRRFLDRYGFRKLWEPVRRDDERGTRSDRKLGGKAYAEAPGVHPSFMLRHLLRGSLVIHKSDVEATLPPLSEGSTPLFPETDPGDQALLDEYKRLERVLLRRIKEDRWSERAGKLFSALIQLPTFLDRATEDCGEYEIRYPESCGGDLVVHGEALPASYVTPKERHLLATLKGELRANRPVLVFLQNTGTAELPARLLRLVQRNVTRRCLWLDAQQVPTHKRQAWILKRVVEAGTQVLFVHPKAVSTGLNCLTHFKTAYWHQLGFCPSTYRQANARCHRIGQAEPVEVHVPYYANTAQAAAFRLMSAKLKTALQVDGLDLRSALAAAGAGGGDAALESSMSLGQALFDAMTTRAVVESRPVPKPVRLVAPPKRTETLSRPAPGLKPVKLVAIAVTSQQPTAGQMRLF